MMIADGHIHSPLCPHGTADPFEAYVEWFIDHKTEEITFTEHAPLPEGFIDTVPTQDSGMEREQLQEYFRKLNKLKRDYDKFIKINIGLEIDYIEGFEKETTHFLNEYGPLLDDSILSVHFIYTGDKHYCIDYSDSYFGEIANSIGNADDVYDYYYRTLHQAIQADLGPYKPRRIGHITLARKFQLKYPPPLHAEKEEASILKAVKKHGYALDYNGAGTAKPFCKEPYPYGSLIEKAIKLGIPLVYGSDAHQVKDLGQGFDQLHPNAVLMKPSSIRY